MRKKTTPKPTDPRDELRERDAEEQRIRAVWRESGHRERELSDALDAKHAEMLDALATAALGGSSDLAEQARQSFYQVQVAATETAETNRHLGRRLEAHKADTAHWLADHQAQLERVLREDADTLAARKADLLRQLAEVNTAADDLKDQWQRLYDAIEYGNTGGRANDIRLDDSTLTPISRGDVAPDAPVDAPSAPLDDRPDDALSVYDPDSEESTYVV